MMKGLDPWYSQAALCLVKGQWRHAQCSQGAHLRTLLPLFGRRIFHLNCLNFCPVTSPTLCKRNQNACFCLFSQSETMIVHEVPLAFSSRCLSSINFHNIPHFMALIHFFVYLLYSNKLFVKGAPVERVPTEKGPDHQSWNAFYKHSLCEDTVLILLVKLRGEITASEGQ